MAHAGGEDQCAGSGEKERAKRNIWGIIRPVDSGGAGRGSGVDGASVLYCWFASIRKT